MNFFEIVGAIILGILAGYLARAFLPGKQSMGFFMTMLLGIAGAFVGYLIFTELLGIGDDDKFDLLGLPGAIIGAMILLFAYERFAGGSSPKQGPAKASAAPSAATDKPRDKGDRDRDREDRDRDREERRRDREQRP